MGCGDVRLLRTIGGLDVTGQERAALNKLTMPGGELGQEVEVAGDEGALRDDPHGVAELGEARPGTRA